MKLKNKMIYNILLIISFVFYTVSLLTLRSETLMTISLVLKLVATSYTAWALSSKILSVSSMIQLFSFIMVFASGTAFAMGDLSVVELMFKQSTLLDLAYILMAVADIILIVYSAQNARDYFINKVFVFFSLSIGVLLVIELLAHIIYVPIFVTILSTIIEFSTYILYSLVLFLDLLHDMKCKKKFL